MMNERKCHWCLCRIRNLQYVSCSVLEVVSEPLGGSMLWMVSKWTLVKHPSAQLKFITRCTHFCIICPVAIAMTTEPCWVMQTAADGKWKLLTYISSRPSSSPWTHKSSLSLLWPHRPHYEDEGTLRQKVMASLAAKLTPIKRHS